MVLMRNIFPFLIIMMAGLSAKAEIVSKPIEYKEGATVLEGLSVYDSSFSGKRPAVLVVHQWKGLGDYEKKRAEMLARLGYNVFAVDIQTAKLELAKTFGAIPVNALHSEPVQEIMRLTNGRGVAVALELIGLPVTMQQAVRCLGVQGRAALAGITEKPFEVFPYAELINKEAEIIGVADHLAKELPELLDFVQKQRLDLTSIITRRLPLEAEAINATLDRLEQFGDDIRSVIEP